MTPDLLLYLKITCQDRINSAYKENKIEKNVYLFAKEWLNLIINLLEPIIHENTKESKQFLNDFLYGYKTDSSKSQISFFTQIKLGTEKLKTNHDNNPLKFFTDKQEKQACNIFLAGLISAIASFAFYFYWGALFAFPISSMVIISCSIMLVFCVAAIHPLQKSKSLENALAELVYFENQVQFMNCDKIRLFAQFESSCNELDLTRITI